jgi:FKBP-type peptidyl-prolyl cis-trans isomerase FkpA
MTSKIRQRGAWLGALAIALTVSGGCNFGSSTPTSPDQSNVQYSQTDLTVGDGAEATVGSTATVQYGLWLYSDTAPNHKGSQVQAQQITYQVGSTNIIKGFDMGVTGMKVGGTRRIICPPSLGFGSNGSSDGLVPPNAALVFDLQLTAVQ